jgi:hypothetical protein
MNNQDQQYLKLLSIFHYVLGGMNLFISIGLLFYTIWLWNYFSHLSQLLNNLPQSYPHDNLLLFNVVPLIICLLAILANSIVLILSARFLVKRKRYWFSLTIACIQLVFMPFGTALGVLTLIVLLRDSVQSLYNLSQP